jgi:hypothetical protein
MYIKYNHVLIILFVLTASKLQLHYVIIAAKRYGVSLKFLRCLATLHLLHLHDVIIAETAAPALRQRCKAL